jgi:hypothetical protein
MDADSNQERDGTAKVLGVKFAESISGTHSHSGVSDFLCCKCNPLNGQNIITPTRVAYPPSP